MIIQSIIFFTFFLFFAYIIEKFMQEPDKEEQLEFKAELKAIPSNHQGENEYNYLRWCYNKGLKPYKDYQQKFTK